VAPQIRHTPQLDTRVMEPSTCVAAQGLVPTRALGRALSPLSVTKPP